MSQSLPPKPSLEHLKKQAKELLAAHKSGDTDAVASVARYFTDAEISLVQAQLVLAREYGFASWKDLSRFVEGEANHVNEFIEAALSGHLERAAELWKANRATYRLMPAAATVVGDADAVGALLADDPTLANRVIGPKDRPLLCYACFSRLANSPEFEMGIRSTVSALLEAGADPNGMFTGEWNGQPVYETALYGTAGVLNNAALTALLLDGGADPNEGLGDAYPYRGEAVYHGAEFPGHNECLRLLFEANVSQAARDYCILRKLDFEDLDGVRMFLDYGASPNRGGTRTPLSHALLRGRSLETIQLLLDKGADPNGADVDGATPYIIARRYGNQAAAKLLAERGARTELSPYDALLAAAAEGDAGEVKRLAAAHPEVLSSMTEYGRQPNDGEALGAAGTILHDLGRAGQVAGLRALLEVGLDPSAVNHYNETPLHWASVAGRSEVVEMLLEAGAPLDVRERNHQADPIGWACWGSVFWQEPHGDYPATVEALLRHGARVPAPTDGSEAVQAVVKDWLSR